MEKIRDVLKKHGFTFKKSLGQNFLTDENLLDSIAEAAGIGKSDTVVEIGCGAGTLTRALSKLAGRVYAYEIDRDLRPVLAETLAGCENTEVIFRDFSKENLGELYREIGEYTVVANLPYYVTTPIVTRLLEEGAGVRGVCVMVQQEVAERFAAKEDTPEYGAITAAIALRGTAKIVKKVGRNMFYPAPNVDSAVVKIDFTENALPVKDKDMYRKTVRCAFLNRRKTLENNLMKSFSLSRETAAEILNRAGVEEKARGETLSPKRLAALSDILCEYAK
ncbi:MAG: ribosomal RNA small subunit methyltransferase A [Firmicutes bacterium]|nr:ribosomal RNA small subunit methyltransferase A [Bacillota bacterium]